MYYLVDPIDGLATISVSDCQGRLCSHTSAVSKYQKWIPLSKAETHCWQTPHGFLDWGDTGPTVDWPIGSVEFAWSCSISAK